MTVIIDRLVDEGHRAQALSEDVRAGLTATPKSLPPRWFYDAAGSQLFELITRLPEYYPTRAERAILERYSPQIAEAAGARALLELGSGSSEKTRLLLDALSGSGTLEAYLPVDVSESALAEASRAISEEYPRLRVHALVADFEAHLEKLPISPGVMVAFLGGTIGNLEPADRAEFFAKVSGILPDDGCFLLGTDLVKSRERLVRAYNDSAGVTAAFNKNVLQVINRELQADFDADAFEHVAIWDPDAEWIEMRLRSTRPQRVAVRELDLAIEFAEGEQMRTEISAKFRRERVAAELASAGLKLRHWWTDDAGDFALSLAVPA